MVLPVAKGKPPPPLQLNKASFVVFRLAKVLRETNNNISIDLGVCDYHLNRLSVVRA